MALREAASAPPVPGPSSESRRPPVVLWRPASRGNRGRRGSWLLARPAPVAPPTPSSRGRHTAGLCQRPCRRPVHSPGLGLVVCAPRPSRSGGKSIRISLLLLNGLPRLQVLLSLSDHFEIRKQGRAWRPRWRCLTASGNLNWAQAAEACSSLPHWQAQITTRFKAVLS